MSGDKNQTVISFSFLTTYLLNNLQGPLECFLTAHLQILLRFHASHNHLTYPSIFTLHVTLNLDTWRYFTWVESCLSCGCGPFCKSNLGSYVKGENRKLLASYVWDQMKWEEILHRVEYYIHPLPAPLT